MACPKVKSFKGRHSVVARLIIDNIKNEDAERPYI